jgi:hypothetical protein
VVLHSRLRASTIEIDEETIARVAAMGITRPTDDPTISGVGVSGVHDRAHGPGPVAGPPVADFGIEGSSNRFRSNNHNSDPVLDPVPILDLQHTVRRSGRSSRDQNISTSPEVSFW